jgi:hypothetical protein
MPPLVTAQIDDRRLRVSSTIGVVGGDCVAGQLAWDAGTAMASTCRIAARRLTLTGGYVGREMRERRPVPTSRRPASWRHSRDFPP